MQDGQNLFDKATAFAGEWQMDETADHLIGSFQIPQMFIVGIDSVGDQRSAEYLPYPDQHNPKSPGAADVHGKEYARFLMTEVMPFLEKKYRIATGPASTGIGGSSYGAVVSLYTALEHPTVFGHVLIESPPLWVGDGQLLKDAEKAKLLPQKIYIGVGTAERRPEGFRRRGAGRAGAGEDPARQRHGGDALEGYGRGGRPTQRSRLVPPASRGDVFLRQGQFAEQRAVILSEAGAL